MLTDTFSEFPLLCLKAIFKYNTKHSLPTTSNITITVLYLLTYLLTPWSRVLLEKLTGFAASQQIPRIYGTRNFITVLTSACHLSLSWARSIQSLQPPPTSFRSLLILSSYLRLGLPNGLVPSLLYSYVILRHTIPAVITGCSAFLRHLFCSHHCSPWGWTKAKQRTIK
jgi:hypothetical protein